LVARTEPAMSDEPAEGIGRVGRLSEPMSLLAFAEQVAAAIPATAQGVRVAGDPTAPVQTVAVVGGAGDSLFDEVRAADVDVYVTADLRHHPASEARERAAFDGGRPYLVDLSHFASEWPWLSGAATELAASLSRIAESASASSAEGQDGTVECRVSTIVTDPWTTVVAP